MSARKIGSIAEADAFAAKARQLLLQHRVDRLAATRDSSDRQEIDSHPVTAQQAGISAVRNRQEWSERLAAAIAEAFHCSLMIRRGSNTVIFCGKERDRASAAQLYTELANRASAACMEEFAAWKEGRQQWAVGSGSTSQSDAAYSRRWKQSFLLGFAQTICQRFVCGHHCMHSCQHTTGLVRIGAKVACPASMPQSRAIGGIDLLYDAVYRGQARAVSIVLDIEHKYAA